MKISLDFENLEEIIEKTLNESLEDRVIEVIDKKIDTYVMDNIKIIIENNVENEIKSYIDKYINETKITIGNEFDGEEIKEYTIKQYINKKFNEQIAEPCIKIEYKDRWGDRQTDKITLKEYAMKKLVDDFDLENKVKKQLDETTEDIKYDVNNKIKDMFNTSVKNSLSDTIFNILSTNETYKKIENQVKMIADK